METFKSMGVKVFGVSTDSAQSHQTWMRMPVKQGGIEGIKFPLVSDTTRDITHAMGSLLPTGFATRSTYVLVDGNIKHASFNETGVGRSSADLLRTVEAIQHHAQHGEVCAASFSKKNPQAMKPTRDGLLEFLNKESV
jgi:peroxiredoxin (alkyl hydroperoxide reductase subunit C)